MKRTVLAKNPVKRISRKQPGMLILYRFTRTIYKAVSNIGYIEKMSAYSDKIETGTLSMAILFKVRPLSLVQNCNGIPGWALFVSRRSRNNKLRAGERSSGAVGSISIAYLKPLISIAKALFHIRLRQAVFTMT